MKMGRLKAQAIAQSDQSWRLLSWILPEIERVADCGPRPSDQHLITGVFHAVVAELHIRAAQVKELEDDAAPQEPTHGT